MKEIQRAKAALFQPQCNLELHREPVREGGKEPNRSISLSSTQQHAVLGAAAGTGETQQQKRKRGKRNQYR